MFAIADEVSLDEQGERKVRALYGPRLIIGSRLRVTGDASAPCPQFPRLHFFMMKYFTVACSDYSCDRAIDYNSSRSTRPMLVRTLFTQYISFSLSALLICESTIGGPRIAHNSTRENPILSFRSVLCYLYVICGALPPPIHTPDS
jgi:hypothetical protein